MNETELRKKLEAKLQVEGRDGLYNPLLQKPVRFDPVGPGSYPAGFGGYTYIGPPPDFGGSYGCYEDTEGNRQYGTRSSKTHSCRNGAVMAFRHELSDNERKALLSQIEGFAENHKCPHCRSEMLLSVVQSGAIEEHCHCPYCGTSMDGAAEKVKQCIARFEEQTMNKESQKPEAFKPTAAPAAAATPVAVAPAAPTIEATPAASPIAAAAPVQAEADLAKEAMKAENPAQESENFKPKAASPLDLKEAQKDATTVEVMKELEKINVKADAAVAAPAPAAPAAAKEDENKDGKKADDGKKAERGAQMKAALARYQAKKSAANAGSVSPTVQAGLKRDLRKMARTQPARFATMLTHPKVGKIAQAVKAELDGTRMLRIEKPTGVSAEIVARVKQELTNLAKTDLAQAKITQASIAKKHPSLKIEAMDLDALAKKDEKKEGEEGDKKGIKGPEIVEPALSAKDINGAESMKHEFLAKVESLKGEKIEMSLYDEQAVNPFWNVTVDGTPVGRVYLGSQKDSDQIRDSFVSSSYAQNFGDACHKVGLQKMLSLANATFYALQIDESEVTSRLRDKAKLEARNEMEDKIATLRKDFMSATALAMTAADKNLYQHEAAHSLKEGLFNALVQAGLNEQYAVAAIESGFEAAPKYFEFIMSKAQEIMDTPKEARESLEKMVSASGKVAVQTGAIKSEDESLMNRLVKASAVTHGLGGIVSKEDRSAIARNLGLKGSAR